MAFKSDNNRRQAALVVPIKGCLPVLNPQASPGSYCWVSQDPVLRLHLNLGGSGPPCGGEATGPSFRRLALSLDFKLWKTNVTCDDANRKLSICWRQQDKFVDKGGKEH